MSSSHANPAKRRRYGKQESESEPEEDDYVSYVPLKDRKKHRNEELNKLRRKAELVDVDPLPADARERELKAILAKQSEAQQSLLAQSVEIREEGEKNKGDAQQKRIETIAAEEKKLMEQLQGSKTALMSAKDHAQDVHYDTPMPPIGDWRPLSKHRNLTEQDRQAIREKFGLECAGQDSPPPIRKFEDMRFPQGILTALNSKGITRPTQIQMQGIPAMLAGRDVIGIAFTGSGKTMVFLLPMVMLALSVELKQPISQGEGPFGLMLAPSRELAVQTEENLVHLLDYLHRDKNSELYKRGSTLRTAMIMGGQPLGQQLQAVQRGVHMVVATPGRLNHLLSQKKIHLQQCKYLAMDEADRMVDATFEEEVRITLDFFGGQRQTCLFSATMPKKVQDFAASMLVKPLIINVGRAGAANKDVSQEVEYVKPEDKHKMVLEALKKTSPPVLVFCDNKSDVDDLHEYLLLKGVEACAIHGGLDQKERLESVKNFKSGKRTVLIGTDVASKGLDFQAIQHVINYDMPKEIENYVHRIGRTGRCGKTGVATTFVNRLQCADGILLDLKAILEESKMRVHPLLKTIEVPEGYEVAEIGGVTGCIYCGGLGHRVMHCPKLESANKEGTRQDMLVSGSRHGERGGYGGDW